MRERQGPYVQVGSLKFYTDANHSAMRLPRARRVFATCACSQERCRRLTPTIFCDRHFPNITACETTQQVSDAFARLLEFPFAINTIAHVLTKANRRDYERETVKAHLLLLDFATLNWSLLSGKQKSVAHGLVASYRQKSPEIYTRYAFMNDSDEFPPHVDLILC
jgi:hypothetical protein